MGLFGGFKAKFTSNVRGKKNNNNSNNNTEDVVCTKYRISSEFEDNTPVVFKHNPRIRLTKPKRALEGNDVEVNRGPSKQYSKSLSDLRFNLEQKSKNHLSTPNPVRKAESVAIETKSPQSPNSKSNKEKPQTIKIRPPYPLPETTTNNNNEEYEDPVDGAASSSNAKPEVKLPPLPKSPPPLHILKENRFQHEYDEPDENTSSNKFGNSMSVASTKSTFERNTKTLSNGDVVQKKEVMETNTFYMNNSVNNKRIAFNITTDDYEDITPVDEYKVSFPVSPEPDLEPSTLILMTQRSGESAPTTPAPTFQLVEDHEDDFKVNFVKHDHKRNYSVSEDEISNNELDFDDVSSYTQMGYTSQAASIFFGFDAEAPVPKPRKVILHKTTDDEEDC